MVEGSGKAREISVGDDFGAVIVRGRGFDIEVDSNGDAILHTSGNVAVHASGNVVPCTNGAVMEMTSFTKPATSGRAAGRSRICKLLRGDPAADSQGGAAVCPISKARV
jgi:hypothetical protein